jgi:hypothetical protein
MVHTPRMRRRGKVRHEHLEDVVVDPAAFVGDALKGRLWPQKSLLFDKSSQMEQPGKTKKAQHEKGTA